MAFTAYRHIPLERCLYLIEPKGGATYQAKCRINGKSKTTGTGIAEGNYEKAKAWAREWFRQLKSDTGQGGETVAQATQAFLDSLTVPVTHDYYKATLAATSEYWKAERLGKPSTCIADITTPVLVRFRDWRKTQTPKGGSINGQMTNNTLRKDLGALRRVLGFAVQRGTLAALPNFARLVDKNQHNPQPWFNPAEWAHLLDVAQQRIDEAPNKRTAGQREELRHFLIFMVYTGLRVGEADQLRVCDCTIKAQPKQATIDHENATGEFLGTERITERYLDITVRRHTSKTGKHTGDRHTESRNEYAADTYKALAAGKKPTDLLFSESHRDSFRELVTAAGLRFAKGMRRNRKCLRETAISHWLLYKPTIPLTWLARNVGTSTDELQNHYLADLKLGDFDGSAYR